MCLTRSGRTSNARCPTNWTCVQIASSPQKQAAPCDLAPPCGVSVQRVLRGRLDAGTS